MRHLVLTRSAYGPSYPLDANRRRLALTLAVTVPCMREQIDRAWTWVVLLDPDDPLRAEREAAFSSAGPTEFLHDRIDPAGRQDGTALGRWSLPRSGPLLSTRLDDDDAIAPWFLDTVARVRPIQRRLIAMPYGWWWAAGHVRPLRYQRNMFLSLYSPDGSRHVMETAHNRASSLGQTQDAGDKRRSWMWVRHRDARGGMLRAHRRPPPEMRATFPIDWTALDGLAYR